VYVGLGLSTALTDRRWRSTSRPTSRLRDWWPLCGGADEWY